MLSDCRSILDMDHKMIDTTTKKIAITTLISIIIFLLFLINLKYSFITIETIEKRKDLIDGISKMISSLILIIGAILTYIKFFKGSTLTEKLAIVIQGRIIKFDKESNYHLIDIEFKNTGLVPIRNLEIETKTDCIEPDIKTEYIEIENDMHSEISKFIIHSQSSGAYNYIYKVPKNSKAVRNTLDITSEKGSRWFLYFTVPNKIDYEYRNQI